MSSLTVLGSSAPFERTSTSEIFPAAQRTKIPKIRKKHSGDTCVYLLDAKLYRAQRRPFADAMVSLSLILSLISNRAGEKAHDVYALRQLDAGRLAQI